MTGTLHTAAID